MRWLIIPLIFHGLIHLMGFAKAFHLADLPQLTQPIERATGVLWLVSSSLILASIVLMFTAPRWWWIVGILAVLSSQTAIFSSWQDAKFGSIPNVLLLMLSIYGLFAYGPLGYRAAYAAQVRELLSRPVSSDVLTERDLAHLPAPVARYVRLSGAVGQPRIFNFRARWRGEIRSDPNAAWMTLDAEQVNYIGEDPARLFFMDAKMFGLPVDVFHSFVGTEATMHVRVASLFPMVDASGAQMSRAETVTILNDLCLLAPAALIEPAFSWEEIDDRSARVTFQKGENIVSAKLFFTGAGELIDFVSDDRLRASPDGKTFTPMRWSTPISDYKLFGQRRVGAHGEARWHAPAPEGEFSYARLDLLEIEYNIR
jgi:hypothetical protein